MLNRLTNTFRLVTNVWVIAVSLALTIRPIPARAAEGAGTNPGFNIPTRFCKDICRGATSHIADFFLFTAYDACVNACRHMTAATGFVSDFDLAAALDEVLEGFPTEADIDPDNEFLWAELGSLAATAVNSVGNFVADHPVLTGVVAAGVAISVGLFLIGIGPGVLVAGLGAGIAAAFSQLSLGTVSAAAAVLLLALLSQTPAYATTPVVAASGTGSSPTASSSADPTPSVQPTSPSSWGSCSGSGPNNGCGTCSECDGRNGALACYPCSGGIFGTCSSSTVCD